MRPSKVIGRMVLATIVLVAVGKVRAAERTAMVHGYVLDSACAFTKNLRKPISSQCARDCAKAGSPLGILADDGTIYWPISDSMPATGQNPKLIEFAGQKVSATGKIFERRGSRAMVIEKIVAETSKP